MPISRDEPADEIRAVLIRLEKADGPPLQIWGLETIKRLQRGAERLGAGRCDVLGPGEFPPLDPGNGSFLVLRTDLVYDERLLGGLRESSNVVLNDRLPGQQRPEALAAHVDATNLLAAIAAVRGLEFQKSGANRPENSIDTSPIHFATALELAPAYNPKLRKHSPPFIFLVRAENIREIENAIFRASYKGITDLVTKWVFPVPARALTRVLAARAVRPNTVTGVGYALTALATWFFLEGWFAAGLVAGWIMTFLDTVDGKLARCTLTSSKIGDVLDHGLDLVHPPIWWAAWAWGLSSRFVGVEVSTMIVVGGYFTGRLLEGVFLLFFKQELFTWQRFDALFRTVIARRNPNLILLSVGTALGRPDLGFIAVAFWTLVANIVPAVRVVQAFVQRSRGIEIQSWYERDAAAGTASTSAGTSAGSAH